MKRVLIILIHNYSIKRKRIDAGEPYSDNLVFMSSNFQMAIFTEDSIYDFSKLKSIALIRCTIEYVVK